MANESLMFKKGLLQNLPSTKQAGTVYITTDERAMYVDISATERIRLGDFIEVTNESDLQNAKYQPYSTTALYYISSSNKLLKYKGTSGSEASFTVINTTTAIEGNLNALTQRVSANEVAITGLQTNLGNLTTTVKNNKTATDKAIADEEARAKAAEKVNADAITAEVERAKKAEQANATNISGLQISVTNLDNNKADKTALQAETEARIAADDTLTTNLEEVADRTTTLEGTVGNSSKGLVKDVADLKNTTSQQSNTITQMQQNHADLASTVSNQGSRLSTVEGVVGDSTGGLVKDVADLRSDLTKSDGEISALKTRATNIETKNSQQDTAISGLQQQVGKAAASGQAATGLYLAIDQLKAKDNSIDQEITNLKNADTALDSRVDDLETNSATKTELGQTNTSLTNFQKTVAATYVTKTDYNEKMTALDEEDDRLEGLIDGHDDRIEKLEGTVGNSTSGLVKDVADLKTTTATHSTNITNLQNSLKNYVLTSTLNSTVSDLNGKINTNKTDIATNKTNIATNKTNIATNAAGVAANKAKSEANEVAISSILSEIGTASTGNADKTIHQLITNLQIADNNIYDHINESFRVADAMKFMGQIETTDALLSNTKVEAGHTYVLTKKSGNYAIGDLFIAKTDGVNDSIADWVHVPSGYVAAHDPKIQHSNSTDSSVVKLISGASNAHLGSIKFTAAANTSTTVEVSNNNDALNPVVTIGMSWGSF